MNRLATRGMAKLRPDRMTCTVWWHERGKVLDDCTLFPLSGSGFPGQR